MEKPLSEVKKKSQDALVNKVGHLTLAYCESVKHFHCHPYMCLGPTKDRSALLFKCSLLIGEGMDSCNMWIGGNG